MAPHNAAVHRSGLLTLLGAVLLAVAAGCSSPRTATTPMPAPGEPRQALEDSTPPPPPAVPTPAAPPVAPKTTATNSWRALRDWMSEHGGGNLTRLSNAPPLFEWRRGPDVLRLTAGSRIARWNGVDVWLGFRSQVNGGELQLKALDLEKVLLPLAAQPVRPPREGLLLVLDPGHGGANQGATNIVNGRPEKEFTLDWARRLEALLSTNGWRVLLTRTNDADVSLEERVGFAERHEADLFISLHFNSGYPHTHQTGLETYCLTPAGMPSSLVRGSEDDPQAVFPNNRYDADNLRLAFQLHRALLATGGGQDRGIKRARFMGVLRGQKRPAVLVEGGFLSNPAEGGRIADERHRQTLAQGLAEGLNRLLEQSREAASTAVASSTPTPAGRDAAARFTPNPGAP